MKIKSLLLAAVASLSLMSCSTYRQSVNQADLKSRAYSDDIYATLSVSEDNVIVGESHAVYLLNIRLSGGNNFAEIEQIGAPVENMFKYFGFSADKIRSLALGDALKDKDYDVVVNPRYNTYQVKHLFGLIKIYDVKVKAYGGKYSKIKAVEHGTYNDSKVIVEKTK